MPVLALVLVLGFSSCQGEGGKLASEYCDLRGDVLEAIEDEDHDAVVEAIEKLHDFEEDNDDDIEDIMKDGRKDGSEEYREFMHVIIDCDCNYEYEDELEDYVDDASDDEAEEIWEAKGYDDEMIDYLKRDRKKGDKGYDDYGKYD